MPFQAFAARHHQEMKPVKRLSGIRPGPNNHPDEEPKAQREEPGQKQHGGKQLRAHAGPTPHSVRRPNQAHASRNTDHQPQIRIAKQSHGAVWVVMPSISILCARKERTAALQLLLPGIIVPQSSGGNYLVPPGLTFNSETTVLIVKLR